jgi:hypothetical protein
VQKTFQEFHLDKEAMIRESAESIKIILPGSQVTELLPSTALGTRLIDELRAGGYVVLYSFTAINGIPETLTVGTESAKSGSLTLDFCEVAERLGIRCRWFRSGKVYYMAED